MSHFAKDGKKREEDSLWLQEQRTHSPFVDSFISSLVKKNGSKEKR